MWSFSKYLTVQGNAFPTLTKHLIHTVVITCSLRYNTRKTSKNFFILLHNFMDRRLILTEEQPQCKLPPPLSLLI